MNGSYAKPISAKMKHGYPVNSLIAPAELLGNNDKWELIKLLISSHFFIFFDFYKKILYNIYRKGDDTKI